MRKAENSSRGETQTQVKCDICGKSMNKKSLARHTRDLHSVRKVSVSSLVSDFDQQTKRKPEESLSPPSSQPDPKKSAKQDPPDAMLPEGSVDGSPRLKVGNRDDQAC